MRRAGISRSIDGATGEVRGKLGDPYIMCRNIKTLFNFDPPATDEEIRSASLQFVRKLSGFTKPSRANEAAFARAVEDVSGIARRLIDSLVTTSEPRNRDEVAAEARVRAAARFPGSRTATPRPSSGSTRSS